MNFRDLQARFHWTPYEGQTDSKITYVYVRKSPIRRLAGDSDILYIGTTDRAIRERFSAQTSTNNTEGSTQNTNIRLNHVFKNLGLENFNCFFIRQSYENLAENEKSDFMERLRTWDKKFYRSITQGNPTKPIPFEKYLLVTYADEHLEVPPMNNSM